MNLSVPGGSAGSAAAATPTSEAAIACRNAGEAGATVTSQAPPSSADPLGQAVGQGGRQRRGQLGPPGHADQHLHAVGAQFPDRPAGRVGRRRA